MATLHIQGVDCIKPGEASGVVLPLEDVSWDDVFRRCCNEIVRVAKEAQQGPQYADPQD